MKELEVYRGNEKEKRKWVEATEMLSDGRAKDIFAMVKNMSHKVYHS